MEYTEVTSQSWFSRLGGAFKGIIVGILLIPISIIVLFTNEGRQVKRSKALEEGQGQVVSIQNNAVNAANEGKLVHLTGKLKASGEVKDSDYGLILKNSLQLKRQVEYFQMQESSSSETKKKIGGGTETITNYTYKTEWVKQPIDSSNFKQIDKGKNTTLALVEETTNQPKNIELGAFLLSNSLKQSINADQKVTFPAEWKLPEKLKGKAVRNGNQIYYGKSPENPTVGDVRVSFLHAPEVEVSVIAQQKGNSFVTFKAKTGTVEMLKTGVHTADTMFEQAEAANKMTSWILRILGAVIMFIGFKMILKPLSVVLDVLPILGNITEFGTSLISLILAATGSSFVIAISWLFHRPLIGGSLLLITVGGIAWLIYFRKKV